jgi:asparagine synthetase B (glutamine-hydrolysing)
MVWATRRAGDSGRVGVTPCGGGRKAVRDAGYKVVYTGEGTDEILGGYLRFRMDILHHNTQGQDAAEIQRLLQQLDNANSVPRAVHVPLAKPDH